MNTRARIEITTLSHTTLTLPRHNFKLSIMIKIILPRTRKVATKLYTCESRTTDAVLGKRFNALFFLSKMTQKF